MTTLVVKPTVEQFCTDINRVIDILDHHSEGGNKKDNFSVLLSGCFIGVYEDLRSAELLAKNHCFFSLLKIARSLYDLAVQLLWIKSLEPQNQKEAVKFFLEFTGKEKEIGWYELLNPRMTMEKMIRTIKMDHVIFTKDMLQLLPPDSKEKGLHIYGYLSKVLHWNPASLKHLIGYKDEQIQIKPGSQMVAVYVGMLAIRILAYVFTENWLQELFSKEICNGEKLNFLLTPIIFPTIKEGELIG